LVVASAQDAANLRLHFSNFRKIALDADIVSLAAAAAAAAAAAMATAILRQVPLKTTADAFASHDSFGARVQ